MGSPLRLQVAGSEEDPAVGAAWSAIVAEFEAAEEAMSRFRDTSEIHRLRRSGGRADTPSRRLVAALTAADRARRVTEGRFDPRVLLDLERLGSTPLPIPIPADGEPASAVRPAPGGHRPDRALAVVCRSGRYGPIEVPIPVDFGGIGKGLALRWAARRAREALGERPFLLEAGGDIVGGGAPGPDGWRIAVEDPRGPLDPSDSAELLVVLELPLRGGSVATSSVRRSRWKAPDGRTVHHLIDPRTGEPGGDGLLAVTVTGSDPAWAEVWSKSLFLEGRRGIAALARARDLAAAWVTSDGAIEMTPRARLRTVWVAGEA